MMRRLPLAAIVVVAAALSASAQSYYDGFNYPPGTTIGGWTEQRGDWTFDGAQALCQPTVTFQELTLDNITDLNGASECLALYDLGTPGLQYAGPVVRHSGSGATATYFMVKVQDNGSPYTGFDRFYVYYYNGASFSAAGITSVALAVPTTAARVRLQAADEGGVVHLNMYIDTDLDGLWDVTAEGTTTLGFGIPGRPGVTGYRNARLDEFKYFAGTLRATALPTIGTSLAFAGSGTPNQVFLCASSLGHAGIPLGGGAVVPLDLDPIFFFSLQTPAIFQNYSGVTAADGAFAPVLNIPNDPILVGLTLWTSGVTFDGFGYPNVFPDVQTTFL